MQRSGRMIMQDRSTVTKAEYIVDHILFGFISGLNLYLYSDMLGIVAYWERSAVRLLLCMVLTSGFGIAISFKNNRRNRGTLLDILSGLGMYMVLTIGKCLPKFTRGLVFVTGTITFVSLLLILFERSRRRFTFGELLKRRSKRIMFVVRRNVGLAAVVVLIVFPVYSRMSQNLNGENGLEDTGAMQVNEAYGKEYKLRANLDTIKLIRNDETFQKLTYDEKCQVVEAVLRCEASYLGLCEFDIVFENLGESTLGSYNHLKKRITINSIILEDGTLPGGTAEEILTTCLHECRHCYQHLLAELYVEATPEQRSLLVFQGNDVAGWVENIADYKSANDDIEGYMDYLTQALETDARSYAASEVKIYYGEIDRLLMERERVQGKE